MASSVLKRKFLRRSRSPPNTAPSPTLVDAPAFTTTCVELWLTIADAFTPHKVTFVTSLPSPKSPPLIVTR